MSFHRLLPSISFLKSDRRISAGSPHPLGATWDGRGTNFALFSSTAEKVVLCLFDQSGTEPDGNATRARTLGRQQHGGHEMIAAPCGHRQGKPARQRP